MKISQFLAASALSCCALAPISSAQAAVYTFNTQFFSVVSSGDPDFGTTPCCTTTYTNEIESTAGAHGLPVYNSAYGGPTLHDVNSSGELTWWSPASNPNVTLTSTTVVSTNASGVYNSNMYAPNSTGGNDAGSYETALFSAVLSAPVAETVTFNIGADDDALIILNGQVVAQEGGIHGVSFTPFTSAELSAGTSYNLQIFYADRQQTGAALEFSIDAAVDPIVTTGVPEASTWAMMLMGFAGIGYVASKKTRKIGHLAIAA